MRTFYSKERRTDARRVCVWKRDKGWKGIVFEAIIGDYAYLLAHYGSLKGPDRDYYVRRTSSPAKYNFRQAREDESSRRASTEN